MKDYYFLIFKQYYHTFKMDYKSRLANFFIISQLIYFKNNGYRDIKETNSRPEF